MNRKRVPRMVIPFLMILLFLVLPLFLLIASPKLFRSYHSGVESFPAPRRLLVVFAHTDDEVTNSGLIRHWANQGSQIQILTLTDGAANPNSDLTACLPKENITQCRLRELSDSAKILGIGKINAPKLPDSRLMEHLPQATQEVQSLLNSFQPDAILTMEPSGLNGLADHRAAFQSVALALQGSRQDQPRLYLSTLPPPFSWVLRSRLPEELDSRIKVFPTAEGLVEIKVEDAFAHRSQSSTINGISLGLGPRRLFSWIDFETYSIHPAKEIDQLLSGSR
ncbi:MAG: PIG-L deacetylase family protein [Silvanigrellaceae bacterium]